MTCNVAMATSCFVFITETGLRCSTLQPRSNLPARPYLIGLTGGIASGKSSVGKRLEALGAGLISSDLLGI